MIFIECYADYTLLSSLAVTPKKGVIHEFKGKGGICNQLRKLTNCLGLIDEDPESHQPMFVTESQIIRDIPEYGIRLLRHKATDNYLIELCPYLEVWVLKAVEQAGIEMSKYNLPDDPKQLHKIINLDKSKFEKVCLDLKLSKRTIELKKLIQRYN